MADPTSGARPARSGAAGRAPAKKAGATAKKAAAAKPAAGIATTTEALAPPAPTKREAPLAASGSTWSLAYKATALVLVFAAFVLLLRMADQERGGPAHDELSIGQGLPATLYLPVEAEDDGDFPEPKPEGQRPPVIVMAHGYSADRASMSGLARSLAEAGYAVLSVDLRGHGANTHRFEGDLRDDFATAVDWATTSPYVDGSRLAVLGHSMGAGAALDFASVDARPKAVIPVSGGWVVNDAHVPANTLLIAGSADPGRIRERQEHLATELDAKDGAAVQRVVVSGANHITILRDDETVQKIVAFLDPILEMPTRDHAPGIVDPRYKTAGLYLLVVLGLIAAIGLAVGQAVPAPATAAGPSGARRPGWSGYALTGAALVLTVPLLAVGGFDLLPLGAGQPIVMHLGLTGAALWAARGLARRGQVQGRVGEWLRDGEWRPSRAGWISGLAGAGAVIALLLPLQGIFHRLVPTPQRALFGVVLTLVAVPFFTAFEALVRRGRGGAAVAAGIGGKVLLLVSLGIGLRLGALPPVITLITPLLIFQYVLLEIYAATAYARGRNTAMIAVTEAVLIAFMAVSLTPVG